MIPFVDQISLIPRNLLDFNFQVDVDLFCLGVDLHANLPLKRLQFPVRLAFAMTII